MSKIANIIEEVSNLTIAEVVSLVEALEEKWNVTAAMAAGPAAPAAGPAAAEEKTSFKVVMTDVGGNKIAVIKAYREIFAGISLVDAKSKVEGALPLVIKEGVDKKEADAIVSAFTEAKATVVVE